MGGGDAVNFTDPFGLCDDGTAWCAFVNGVARQTAPMNRAAEAGARVALGVSGAGDVIDEIGQGSVVIGAIAVAGMLPVGKIAKVGKRAFSAADRVQGWEAAKDAVGVARCRYCGTPLSPTKGKPTSYEADHGTAFARGGESTFETLVPSCRVCNRSKGAKDWWDR